MWNGNRNLKKRRRSPSRSSERPDPVIATISVLGTDTKETFPVDEYMINQTKYNGMHSYLFNSVARSPSLTLFFDESLCSSVQFSKTAIDIARLLVFYGKSPNLEDGIEIASALCVLGSLDTIVGPKGEPTIASTKLRQCLKREACADTNSGRSWAIQAIYCIRTADLPCKRLLAQRLFDATWAADGINYPYQWLLSRPDGDDKKIFTAQELYQLDTCRADLQDAHMQAPFQPAMVRLFGQRTFEPMSDAHERIPNNYILDDDDSRESDGLRLGKGIASTKFHVPAMDTLITTRFFHALGIVPDLDRIRAYVQRVFTALSTTPFGQWERILVQPKRVDDILPFCVLREIFFEEFRNLPSNHAATPFVRWLLRLPVVDEKSRISFTDPDIHAHWPDQRKAASEIVFCAAGVLLPPDFPIEKQSAVVAAYASALSHVLTRDFFPAQRAYDSLKKARIAALLAEAKLCILRASVNENGRVAMFDPRSKNQTSQFLNDPYSFIDSVEWRGGSPADPSEAPN